jgi:DUF1009 family protein
VARRLSVLAGSGPLVAHVVDAALAAGDEVQVISLVARGDTLAAPVVRGDASDPAAAIQAIIAFGSTHLTMAGAISLGDRQRETLAEFTSGDASGTAGDAELSQLGATLQRLTGAHVLGVHEIAPDLLAQAGRIAGPPATAAIEAAAAFALEAARAIGRIDLGQAVVTAGRRVIAAEDVGGTDELIARVELHRRNGLAGDGSDPLILAKAAKPHQPLSIDLPSIGPNTVRRAAAAGIAIIAVEAGRSLVLERQRLIVEAERLGVSVIGLANA